MCLVFVLLNTGWAESAFSLQKYLLYCVQVMLVLESVLVGETLHLPHVIIWVCTVGEVREFLSSSRQLQQLLILSEGTIFPHEVTREYYQAAPGKSSFNLVSPVPVLVSFPPSSKCINDVEEDDRVPKGSRVDSCMWL